MRCSLRFFLLANLVWAAARAQTADTAAIVGTVRDSSGAAIASAAVELIDVSSRQARRQVTSGEGQYTITGIVPGNYKITAEAPGFR